MNLKMSSKPLKIAGLFIGIIIIVFLVNRRDVEHNYFSDSPQASKYVSKPYTSQQIDDDNEKVDAITADIQQNGPSELRQLDPAVIRGSVQTFVSGERSGVLNPSQLLRMGGVEGAAENSLTGQLHAARGQ